MSIRVGTVVNIMKAWGTYQDRLAHYRAELARAQAENNIKDINCYKDYISMTEAEIGEFLNIVV